MRKANRLTTLLAALLIALATMLFLAVAQATASHDNPSHTYDGHIAEVFSPWGNTYTHDCNGRVPERIGPIASSGVLAQTSVGCEAKIKYDGGAMSNATNCGWATVIRHERAHARGFGHGEGFPPNGDGIRQKNENPAYYSSANTRCTSPGGTNEQAVDTKVFKKVDNLGPVVLRPEQLQ